MKHRFFVTGTDTDVGKTFVSCGLLRSASLRGLTTTAIKPVAAGCEQTDEGLRNEDAILLRGSISEQLDYAQLNPVALEEPIAPHIAAKNSGVSLKLETFLPSAQRFLESDAGFGIMEGAGGWRVPLDDETALSALPKALDLPVILVVGLKLGCLNHAILTAEAIAKDGLKLVGWVANQPQETPMPYQGENISWLKSALKAPLLAEVPWLGRAGTEAPHYALEALFDAL